MYVIRYVYILIITMVISKEQLISNLKNNIYCIIDKSDIHGVGVFAIRTIPANTNPFILADGNAKVYNTIGIVDDDLKGVPKSVVKLLDKYLIPDDYYPVISNGLNDMDISFYINHSDTPNVKTAYTRGNDLLEFNTIRKIKKGEELLYDYNS